MEKIKINYLNNSITGVVTFKGQRNRLNQYNQDVQFQEVRALIHSTVSFQLGSVVTISGKEYKVTYLDQSKRPASVTFSDNVFGV